MKKLGICYPVYNNQKAVDKIIEKLKITPCEITMVDDGSNPPIELINNIENIKLIRIDSDRAWNQAQANNVAIENSTSEVVLRMDIDHYINPEDYEKFLMISENLPKKTIYQFKRFRTDTNEFIKKGCNIIMIKKSDFLEIGKYSEEFCGNYGYEDLEFQHRAKLMGFSIKEVDLVIYVDAQLKTPGLNRDTTINKEIFLKKINETK